MPRCSEKYYSRVKPHGTGGILETSRKIISGKKTHIHTPNIPQTKMCFSLWRVDYDQMFHPRLRDQSICMKEIPLQNRPKCPKSLMFSSHNQAFSNTDYFQKSSQKINPPSLNPNPESAVPVFSFREGMVDISSTCIIRPADLLDPRF